MSTISNLASTDAPLWNTPKNHGPLVSVISWFLGITAFLSILARVATRVAVVRQLRWDDASIMFAMLLSIAQIVTTSLQASNGLGQHIDSVSPRNLTQFQKVREEMLAVLFTLIVDVDVLQNTYASGFLYLGVLSSVKISICLYLSTLTPVRLHKTIILALGAFTCFWLFSCFLVLGFQCDLPRAWQIIGGRCIDIAGFWTYAHVINIFTDIALIILPWVILSKLQVETRRKVIIIGCFAARSVVVAVTIVQIYYLQSQAAGSHDLTFDLWRVVLSGEVILALSLVTACIPYLKPFLEALETGMIRADGGAPSRGHGFGYGNRSSSRYRKYGPSSKLPSKHSHAQLSGMRMENLGFSGEKRLEDGSLRRQTATVSTKGHGADSDDDSQTSQSKIIRKTVGWSVTEENQSPIPPHTHLEYPSRTEYAHAV